MDIHDDLISWYLVNKRDLPWRNTRNPYLIWLSEIILQQTRVDQGLAYYYRFSETYPTIGDLADATEEDVLKLWQGLGYYSRGRNLLKAAQKVRDEYNGVFPNTYDGIISLPGVGPYTAAAIASFAFQLSYAVVDGNVSRVLSRLFDESSPINSAKGKKLFQKLADDCLSQNRPDLHNQAMMELGALVCTPRNPSCRECPLASKCLSLSNETVDQRPQKIKGKKARERQIDYIILQSEDRLLMRKRTGKDIWQGLFDFPSLELDRPANSDEIYNLIQKTLPQQNLEGVKIQKTPLKTYQHILSHQKLKARFWHCEVEEPFPENSIYLKKNKNQLGDVPVPRLIHQYLTDSSLI